MHRDDDPGDAAARLEWPPVRSPRAVAPFSYTYLVSSVYEVAYREAVRAVDEQATVLEQIRARAGTLFSAAGVTAGVLGLAVKDATKAHGAAASALWVAAVAFVALAASTVAVWWPVRRGWFLMDARLIIRDSIEGDVPLTLDELHRDMALHHGENAVRNAKIIRRRLNWYVGALVAFAAFVGALVTGLVEVI